MKKIEKFLELAEYILRSHSNIPLTANQIWSFANEDIQNGIIRFSFKTKTPHASLGSRLYQEVINNTESIFIKTEDRPAKFYLKTPETQYEISLLNDDKIISNNKSYYCVRLGQNFKHAQECYEQNYCGVCWDIDQDLSVPKSHNFKNKFLDNCTLIYLTKHQEKNQVSAGRACGQIWTLLYEAQLGDILICPFSDSELLIGKITGLYAYDETKTLPHTRSVKWLSKVSKNDISFDLKRSLGSQLSVFQLNKYADEIEELLDTQNEKKEMSQIINDNLNIDNSVAITNKTNYEITVSNKIDNDKNLEIYMHPILKQYLETRYIFSVTVNHQKSKRGEIKEQWFYPDMVGVGDIGKHSPDVVKFSLRQSLLISLYSYELKQELNKSNVRELYFQALSNSSWANEGYLVVRDIEYTGDLRNEVVRLHNLFGIGLIKLDMNKPESSEILLTADRRSLDVETIDKLSKQNEDFKGFIKTINNILDMQDQTQYPTEFRIKFRDR